MRADTVIASDRDGGDDGGGMTATTVYAVTQTQMYRIDQGTLVESVVNPLCNNIGGFQVADLAVSSTGQIYVSDMASTGFHAAGPGGTCTLITNLAVRQYGLAFVPPGVLGGTEVLLGGGDNNNLYRINPATGALQLIGPLGSQPGDFAWTGTQLLATSLVGATFHLGVVNTTTGAITDIGDTTYANLYGLVFANGKLLAFSATAGTIELDPATGGTVRSRASTPAWYGASTGP